jgi:DNA-binding Lrp family transcriptional regulator
MDELDRAIINALHGGFPISAQPFLEAAHSMGVGEEELIVRLRHMLDCKTLTRFGPLYQAERLGGAYTLAAIQVPDHDYERVAALVNRHPEVAHNYRREHAFNMWFVVAAGSQADLGRVLQEIGRDGGYAVVEFPKLREYFVDLELPV